MIMIWVDTRAFASTKNSAPCIHMKYNQTGLSALYLEYWLLSSTYNLYALLVTVCHRLFACHRWKERASFRTIRWKEQASSRSRRHVFHPNECLCSRVTGQSASGSARMRLLFSVSSHTYVRTHTWTQPTVSIIMMPSCSL